MFCFTYGSSNNLVEFLHWENFVIAHCLAAEALNDNPCLVVSVYIFKPHLPQSINKRNKTSYQMQIS